MTSHLKRYAGLIIFNIFEKYVPWGKSTKPLFYYEIKLPCHLRFRRTSRQIEKLCVGACCHKIVTTCPRNILCMVNRMREIVTTCPININPLLQGELSSNSYLAQFVNYATTFLCNFN